MSETPEYVCIGVCTPEPLSGACLGCGRPLLPPPAVSETDVSETDASAAVTMHTPSPLPVPKPTSGV
jgi:hypothetical protein